MKCNECYEDVSSQCKGTCEDVFDADCIFYNMNADTSKNLKFLKVKGGSSFSRILRAIDSKLGESINATFEYFKTSNISTVPIITQKQFVEGVDTYVKNTKTTLNSIQELNVKNTKDIIDTNKEIDRIDTPKLEDSIVGINTVDDSRTVLEKLISSTRTLLDKVTPIFKFTSSDTIEVQDAGTNIRDLKFNLKISDQPGNLLTKYGNGLFAAQPSSVAIMKKIKDSEEAKAIFNQLIASYVPQYSFSVQNIDTSSIQVKYVSALSKELAVAEVGPGQIRSLRNVQSIITDPHSKLLITFKGIDTNGM